MRLTGHGLSVEVPAGWEGRIYRRHGGGPVVHLATFALRESDGDFGGAATGRMRDGDVFAALIEYADDSRIAPGRGLFAARGRPTPAAHEFGDRQLQITRSGQLGWQRFFTEADRACCLYAVIQPGRERPHRLVEALSRVLATVQFAKR